MSIAKNRNVVLVAAGVTLAALVFYLFLQRSGTSGPEGADQGVEEISGFVGSKACAECHDRFYKLWEPSTHGKAMRNFDAAFHKEHLVPNDTPIEVMGKKFQAILTPEGGEVRELHEDGTYEAFPILFALGAKNVFFFLTPLEKGKLQVLPVAFDIREKVWYDTAASMLRNHSDMPDEPLDWRERQFTWNASCFSCHVSQLEKGYSLVSDTYESRWLETGINCETCHGPSSAHVQAARKAAERKEPLTELHLLSWKDFNSEESISGCSVCHAKFRQYSPAYEPSQRYFDHFGLVALEDRDFYPDGRDLGENFTYTSYLMSGCKVSEDFTCIHCHTSSGRMRQKGEQENEMCAPCHQELVDNPAQHSHHKAEGEGSLCAGCHMPETAFARMRRHDHSMLAPTPAATEKFGSPNACNVCHEDKSVKWADEWVGRWYSPGYQKPQLDRGILIDSARKQDWSRVSEYLDFAKDPTKNEIFRASLVRLLDSYPGQEKCDAFAELADDESILVRSSAVRALASCGQPGARDALVKAASDDYRLVRLEAGFSLSHFPMDSLAGDQRRDVLDVFKEYEEAMLALEDDPHSKQNLGLFFQNRGDLRRSVSYYQKAIQLSPENEAALVNLSLVYAQLGQTDEALSTLQKAIAVNPDRAEAHFNLGLLHAEMGRQDLAEASLREALAKDANFSQAAYNLGVLLAGRQQMEEAFKYLRQAATSTPDQPRFAYSLAFFLRQANQQAEAVQVLEKVLAVHPESVDAIMLLGTMYEEGGRADRARGVYLKALESGVLPPQIQQQVAGRLQTLGR